jgi:hypothetical protein
MGLPRQARRKSLSKFSDRPKKKSLLVRTTGPYHSVVVMESRCIRLELPSALFISVSCRVVEAPAEVLHFDDFKPETNPIGRLSWGSARSSLKWMIELCCIRARLSLHRIETSSSQSGKTKTKQ